MAPMLAYTLPAMQLVCNLVIVENPVSNNTVIPGPNGNNSIPAIPPAALPNGYVAHHDIGVAYKVYNVSVDWKTARGACIEEGARLAVIDTHAKFEQLISQVPTLNTVHVGIHRMYDDAYWVSATTGEILSNLRWAPGYPAGATDCLAGGYNPRGLRNVRCVTTGAYVCELPIQGNYSMQVNGVVEISTNEND